MIVVPLRISPTESSQWSESGSLWFKLAYVLARYMPRGKGWFPRRIGRVFCKKQKTIIRTANHAQLAVDPSNLDIYATILLKHGTWEPHILSACKAVCRPGDVFFDIGANAGYFSIEMGALFNDTLNIYAFEPQPSLAHAVAVSAQLNNFTKMAVYQIMFGKMEGNAELFIPSHSIHASVVSREPRARRMTCPMTTLDRLIESGDIPPPSVMKIDVEGGEMDVFHGAESMLQAHAPYIIFESDENMKRFSYKRSDIFAYLHTLANYSFFYATKEGLRPAINNLDDMSLSDILAVPPGKSPF